MSTSTHLKRAAGLLLALGVGCGVSAAQEAPAPGAPQEAPAGKPEPLTPQEAPPSKPEEASKDGEPQGHRPIDEATVRALAEEIARLRAEIAQMKGEPAPGEDAAQEPFTPAGTAAGEEPVTPAEETSELTVGTKTQGPGEVIVIHGDPPAAEVREREVVVEREVPVYIDREVVVETAPTVYYEQVIYRDVSCWQSVSCGHSHYAGCGHHYYGCSCHPWYYDLSPGFSLQFVYIHDDHDDHDHHHHNGVRHSRDWSRNGGGSRAIASGGARAPGKAEPVRSLPGVEPITSPGTTTPSPSPGSTVGTRRGLPSTGGPSAGAQTWPGTKAGKPNVPVILGDPPPARAPGTRGLPVAPDRSRFAGGERTVPGRDAGDRTRRTAPDVTAPAAPSAPTGRRTLPFDTGRRTERSGGQTRGAPQIRRVDPPAPRRDPTPQRTAPRTRTPDPVRVPQQRTAPRVPRAPQQATPTRSAPAPRQAPRQTPRRAPSAPGRQQHRPFGG